MMSRKVATSANKIVYAEDTFLWEGLCIPSFSTIDYVVDKQSGICRRYLLLQGLCVPSVKTTTYACNRFNTSFCAEDHKTNQAISNLNGKFWIKSTLIWLGFLGVRFYPWSLRDYEFENYTFIWIRIHILHLVHTTSLTDLCFNKKFERYKNVFLNRFLLILAESAHVPTCLACLRANVPCVLTCQRALRAYVVTCFEYLRAHVPCVLTWSRANVLCVLSCSCASVPCVLSCSHGNVPCVLTCSRGNVPCVPCALTDNVPCVLTYRKYQQFFLFWSEIVLLPCLVLGWEKPIDESESQKSIKECLQS